jgi:hypothetical protein
MLPPEQANSGHEDTARYYDEAQPLRQRTSPHPPALCISIPPEEDE